MLTILAVIIQILKNMKHSGNKSYKGFTLIELLVVVAIIGILAAVGVVAYNGYTNSAKINSAKSVHSKVVKYITAELTKCNLETTIFEGNFNCNDKTNPSTQANSVSIVVTSKVWGQGTSSPTFKHPDGTYSSVSGRTTNYTNRVTCNSMWKYNTLIENSSSEVKIVTCPDDQDSNKLISIISIE